MTFVPDVTAIFDKYSTLLPSLQRVLLLSSLQNVGVNDVISLLQSNAQEKPWIYPEGVFNDTPLLDLIENAVKAGYSDVLAPYLSKLLRVTVNNIQEEYTEEKDSNGKLVAYWISVDIHVEQDSQTKFLLGPKGALMNTVRDRVVQFLSEALGAPVRLYIKIKS